MVVAAVFSFLTYMSTTSEVVIIPTLQRQRKLLRSKLHRKYVAGMGSEAKAPSPRHTLIPDLLRHDLRNSGILFPLFLFLPVLRMYLGFILNLFRSARKARNMI